MKHIGKAFKQFFSSLWEDFVALIKNHYLKFIGFVIMFIVPICVIIGEYISKTPAKSEKWTIPVFVLIPLAILLLVYWGKAKRWFAIKVQAMKTENELQKGKHAGAIITCTTIQMLGTILPFALFYIVFKNLEETVILIKDLFLFLTICEAVGGVFIILDSIKNCVDYSEEESNE